MDGLLQDLRFGLRTLLKSPGFTAIAIVTLALGIGANTAMFSVIDAVLLRPFPFGDPGRVLAVYQVDPNGQPNAFSTSNYLEWKRQGARTVMGNAGAFTPASFNLSHADTPERVQGGRMSWELFSVLRVQPQIGRGFTAEEDRPNGGNLVLLSDALWRSRFGGDRNIVGQSILLDSVPYIVVGVMPARFSVLANTELAWTPLQMQPDPGATQRTVHWFWVFVRMPPGISKTQTEAELKAVADRVRGSDANSDTGRGLVLQTLSDFYFGNVKMPLLVLMGCVALVLLIACSNVANLMLARGAGRRQEIAVRAALGAARLRIARQLLTESVLLAALGGVAGLAISFACIRLLKAVGSSAIPNVETISLSLPVLGFTLAVCLVAGVLFGTAPAIDSSHVDLNDSLKEGARGSSPGGRRRRLALVVTETALACLLLIGAGLALKNMWLLARVPLGFNPEQVLTVRVAAPSRITGANFPSFYREVLERVRPLPGMQEAALGRDLPMSGGDPSMPITVQGDNPALQPGEVLTRYRTIGPGYFHLLQVPLLRGRDFSDSDTASSIPVVIVSETLARRYWPGKDAIGQRLKPNLPDAPWYAVVGVAAAVHHWSAEIDAENEAYYPYTQVPPSLLPRIERYMTIAVRTSLPQSDAIAELRSAMDGVDKSVPLFAVQSMNQMVADSGSLRRFDMALLGAFAALALLLAAVGVYGVMAYSVAQRTREIGIRMAMGAQRSHVLRLIVGEGAKVALVGVVIGVVSATALTRLMASLLAGVSPRDGLTFTVAPLLMMALILLASYIPARRATRIDPLQALRAQ